MAPEGKKRGRRLLLVVGILLALVILLVAAAPTLVSMGLFRGTIENAISDRLNGTARIGTLSVGWFGTQQVRDLQVVDDRGADVASVDVTVDEGLFALALGRYDKLDVSVGGDVFVERRDDGTINVLQLVPPGPEDDAPPSPLPVVHVDVDRMRVSLVDRPNDVTIDITDLSGAVEAGSGAPLSIALKGDTKSGTMEGSIHVRGQADQLLAPSGGVTLAGSSAQFEFGVNSIPVPFITDASELRQLTFVVSSTDLAERIDTSLNAEASIAGQEPSSVSGSFVVAPRVDDEGAITVDLAGITGSLEALRLPLGVFQPFLDQANLPVQLERDVGKLADAALALADEDGAVTVAVKAEHVDLAVEGLLDEDSGEVRGRRFHLHADAQPALLADAVALETAAPIGVDLDLDSFTIPTETLSNLGLWAMSGVLSIPEAASLTRTGSPGSFDLGGVELEIESEKLADDIHVHGSVLVSGATLAINERIRGLFDADGAVAADAAILDGFVELTTLSPALLEPFIPDQVETARALFGDDAKLRVDTDAPDGRQRIVAALSGARSTVSIAATRDGSDVEVGELAADLRIRPALAQALQADAAQPIRLVKPTSVRLAVDPFVVANALGGEPTIPNIAGSLSADPIIAEPIPAATEALAVQTLDVPFELRPANDWSVTASPAATFAGADSQASLGTLSGSVDLSGLASALAGQVTLMLDGLAVNQLETMLGREPGLISGWTGDSGRIETTARAANDAWQTTLDVSFPRLTGAFTADLANDILTLQAQNANATIAKETLDRMLSADDGENPSAAHVTSDLAVALELPTLRMPVALFGTEPVDPDVFSLQAQVRGGPLTIDSEAEQLAVDRITIDLSSSSLTSGLNFALAGVPRANAQEGTIDISGTLAPLVAEDGVFQPKSGALEMDGTVATAPTALLDFFLELEGLLVAAVGPTMDATLSAKSFSPDSGNFQTRVETPNGWLETVLRGRGNALRIPNGSPLKAKLALTPELRERLLSKIHPIFADVRTAKKRISVDVPSAVIPMDQDRSRLRADFTIEVGEVEIDSGSVLLTLLSFTKSSQRDTISGVIEPIQGKIRDGVLTYDRFAMQIDKFTLQYEGSIDLVNRTLDLRTTIPLAALGDSIRELRNVSDKIEVPIVTRGTLDAHETKIDPDFDLAGAALNAGFSGAINDVLGGNPIDKLIGGGSDDDEKPRRDRDKKKSGGGKKKDGG